LPRFMYQNMRLKIHSNKRWLLLPLLVLLPGLVFLGGRLVSFLVWNYLLFLTLPLLHSLYGAWRVKAAISAPAATLFVGDSFTIECRVRNPSALDWPLASFGNELESAFGSAASVRQLALPAKADITWATHANCLRRGKFRMSQAVLSISDIFNLYTVEKTVSSPVCVTVYPRAEALDLIRVSGNRQPGDLPLMDLFVRNLAETVGLETYRPGTPVRYLHWKASARSPVWLQRSFGRSGDASCTILLNSAAADWSGDQSSRLADLAVGICASLAHYFLKAGIKTTLVYFEQESKRALSGADLRAMPAFFEALAAFSPAAGQASMANIVAGLAQGHSSAESFLFITPVLDDALTLALLRVYLAGGRPLCLLPVQGSTLSPASPRAASQRTTSERAIAILGQHGLKVLKIEKEGDLAHAIKQV